MLLSLSLKKTISVSKQLYNPFSMKYPITRLTLTANLNKNHISYLPNCIEIHLKMLIVAYCITEEKHKHFHLFGANRNFFNCD